MIKLTKKETIQLITEYFQQKEGKKVKVRITSKKECVGLYEAEDCVTRILVSEEIDLLGLKKQQERVISQDELKEIFNILLEKEGYIVQRLTYDDGLKSHYEGYYMAEREVKTAYFKGINIDVVKKEDKPKSRIHKLN